MEYQSEIELGGTYRDEQTRFEGVAIYVTFHQHSCERAAIEGVSRDGDIKAYEFDAVRLTLVRPPKEQYEKPVTGASATGHVRSTGRRTT